MEKGLGARWMGILFSIFLIIAFGFVFNSVQANTITGAMQPSACRPGSAASPW